MTTITKLVPTVLALLQEHGFKTCFDGITDTVAPDFIKSVRLVKGMMFEVSYSKGPLEWSRFQVVNVEVPEDLNATWILVNVSAITDYGSNLKGRKPGKATK